MSRTRIPVLEALDTDYEAELTRELERIVTPVNEDDGLDDDTREHVLAFYARFDACPRCGKQGGEYTSELDECAFC